MNAFAQIVTNKDGAMLLTRAELAKLLGVSPQTVSRYEANPDFPRRIVLPGGNVRYLLSDITSYIEALRG